MEPAPQLPKRFQSTPSARRATTETDAWRHPAVNFNPRPPRGGRQRARAVQTVRKEISIHALREEGDGSIGRNGNRYHDFNPRPPRGGRLQDCGVVYIFVSISIHALREEGDLGSVFACKFGIAISIHALREEGDQRGASMESNEKYFNPRPPRGGRLKRHLSGCLVVYEFQSTPSARRATVSRRRSVPRQHISIHALREEGDHQRHTVLYSVAISIHALREEGDTKSHGFNEKQNDFNPRPPRGGRLLAHHHTVEQSLFQSTPSARRATRGRQSTAEIVVISIHALREEGDLNNIIISISHTKFQSTPSARRATVGSVGNVQFSCISIHALREEGDGRSLKSYSTSSDFNPRPPRGGRPEGAENIIGSIQFQSTPSARRATRDIRCSYRIDAISIHALREEGDRSQSVP